ncbi:MAG: hypothetical protein ACRYG8_12720 [Janthinobacterium lividum]
MWKLDRLGCDLHHLLNFADELTGHGVGCGFSPAKGRSSTRPSQRPADGRDVRVAD